MKIIKRDGKEVDFDYNKIVTAVKKANLEVSESKRLSDADINHLAKNVEHYVTHTNYQCNVENIQDLVARVISGDMQAFEAIRGMYGVPGRHGKISSVRSARQDQAGRAGL